MSIEEIDLAQLDDQNEWSDKWMIALARNNMSKKAEIDFLLRQQKKEWGFEFYAE